MRFQGYDGIRVDKYMQNEYKWRVVPDNDDG